MESIRIQDELRMKKMFELAPSEYPPWIEVTPSLKAYAEIIMEMEKDGIEEIIKFGEWTQREKVIDISNLSEGKDWDE